MNMFKKGLLATAAAMTLGVGAMGSAYAGTYATSILQIENFSLRRLSDNTVFSQTDFSTLRGTNDAHVTAELNNVFNSASDSVPIPGIGPNLGKRCVGSAGDCGSVPTNFTGLPPFTGTYGSAAQFLGGSVIDPGSPANARTRADAATATNMNTASGNSDVGTSTTFQFALARGDDMVFDFDATANTVAAVTGGSGPTSNANARLSWSINILDVAANAVVYSFAPGQLNSDAIRSATDANPGPASYFFTDHFGDEVGALRAVATGLTAGTLYQITIQHNTLANVLQEEVPEPATLAILAAGLLSMSLVSRRRKS